MKTYLGTLKTFFGVVGYVPPNSRAYGDYPVLDISYFNGLMYPVEVIDRRMIRTLIRPSGATEGGVGFGKFIIRVRYHLRREDVDVFLTQYAQGPKFDPNNEASSEPEVYAKVAQGIMKIRGNAQASYSFGTNAEAPVVCVDYSISNGYFPDYAFYFHDLDLIVTKKIRDENVVHPFSRMHQGVIASQWPFRKLSEKITGLTLTMVDNNRIMNKKYVNVLGKVHIIEPIVDDTRDSGLYIAGINMIDVNSGENNRSSYLKLEELTEDAGFFNSYPDALKNGTRQELAVKELAAMKLELQHAVEKNKLLEQECEENTKKIKLEQAKSEKEFFEYKLNRDKLSMQDKDFYEQKNQIRKDINESVKTLPNIIVGVGAIITAIVGIIIAIKK